PAAAHARQTVDQPVAARWQALPRHLALARKEAPFGLLQIRERVIALCYVSVSVDDGQRTTSSAFIYDSLYAVRQSYPVPAGIATTSEGVSRAINSSYRRPDASTMSSMSSANK